MKGQFLIFLHFFRVPKKGDVSPFFSHYMSKKELQKLRITGFLVSLKLPAKITRYMQKSHAIITHIHLDLLCEFCVHLGFSCEFCVDI